MDRNDFEHEVIAHLESIRAAYKKYNPKAFEGAGGDIYLSLNINGNTLSCINRYWDAESIDYHFPVDVYVNGSKYTSFPH